MQQMTASESFQPDANESMDHRQAKERLVKICREIGMDAEIEVPIVTEYKTYYCDVLASFSICDSSSRAKLDLEVEDHDHSKHDFDDADNKAKELHRHFVKTIWFKSSDIVGKSCQNPSDILLRILEDMMRKPRPARMNI